MPADRVQFDTFLCSVLSQLALTLGREQIEALYRHWTLLELWSKRLNLTAIRTPEGVAFRHFGESLVVAKVVGAGSGPVVDIGSGAGFPGVPVAVCWPDREVTLVESVGKKASFLKEVARGQSNLRVFEGRFERFEARAEWAIMRGVAPVDVAGRVCRVAERMAVIVSATRAAEVAVELGLEKVDLFRVPWDDRTAVVAGALRSSST